jgi:hypothetical protein
VPRRQAFAAIALVISASVLLFIWAGAQHFVTASVRKRVRLAETKRAATLQALSSAEQLTIFLPALLSLRLLPELPPDLPDTTLDQMARVEASLAGWNPPGPLDLEVTLPWMSSSMKHVRVKLETGRLLMHVEEVRGGPDDPFDPATDCERYGAWRNQGRWADVDEGDAALTSARRAAFPGWSPVVLEGLGLFEGTSVARGHGVETRTTATLLRQVRLQTSPCPAEDPASAGPQLQVHPVELGRRVRTHRKGLKK